MDEKEALTHENPEMAFGVVKVEDHYDPLQEFLVIEEGRSIPTILDKMLGEDQNQVCENNGQKRSYYQR